jgi:hypothetical protein
LNCPKDLNNSDYYILHFNTSTPSAGMGGQFFGLAVKCKVFDKEIDNGELCYLLTRVLHPSYLAALVGRTTHTSTVCCLIYDVKAFALFSPIGKKQEYPTTPITNPTRRIKSVIMRGENETQSFSAEKLSCTMAIHTMGPVDLERQREKLNAVLGCSMKHSTKHSLGYKDGPGFIALFGGSRAGWGCFNSSGHPSDESKCSFIRLF